MIYTRFDGVEEYENQIDFNRYSHLVEILHRIKEGRHVIVVNL